MKECKKCHNEFGYIDFGLHKCYTVKEWKKFRKFTGDFIDGNELTAQEILIDKYEIFLIDHKTKRSAGKMCPTPLKEKMIMGIKNLPSKITQKNFDKGMKKFDKGMKSFDKALSAFSSGMGDVNSDLNKIGRSKGTSRGNRNLEKLWGKKKNQTAIWGSSEKEKTSRKKSRDKRTQGEKNVDFLWGKGK